MEAIMNKLVKKLKSLPYTEDYILNVSYWLNYYGTRDLECFELLRIRTKHKTSQQIWDKVQALPNCEVTYPKIRVLLKFLRDKPVCVNGKFLELDIAVYEDELNGDTV
jgi:hypothetical protein